MAGLPTAEIFRNVRTGDNQALADCINSLFQASGANAAAGLVPKPPTNAGTTHFLREDGTWAIAPGSGTDAGIRWLFSTTTAMADPSAGNLRFNNATYASVTAIAISVDCAESGNPSVQPFIAQWDQSTSTVRAYLIVKDTLTPQNFAIFSITGASVNNTTWYQLAVTAIASNGAITNGDSISVQWVRVGDQGSVSVPIISPAVQILTSTQTVTIPANATKLKVTLCGGGGGSGGSAANACSSGIGGAGGAAGVLMKYLSGLTPGNTLALTIGAAGSAGANTPTGGGNGGDTTLASGTQAITTLTAAKGAGGAAGNLATGANGASGTGTNGDINIKGGTASITVSAVSGLGFSTVVTQIAVGGSSAAGVAANGFGGGALGAISAVNGASEAGAAGTAGCAIFEWFL